MPLSEKKRAAFSNATFTILPVPSMTSSSLS
jgi:hypothetical protein